MTTIKANGRDLELKTDQDIALYPTNNIWISQGTKLIFEGTIPDDFEVKLQATSVTADRDLILPDSDGTIATQEWANAQGFGGGGGGSLNNIVEDTTPELGGSLVTAGNRITHAASGNVSHMNFTTTQFGQNNNTVLSSVKSIHFFLDSNGGDSSQAFRIYNNVDPDNLGVTTESDYIFKVLENGDVNVTGKILLPDGSVSANYAGFGNADDLKIFHNGTHSIVRETGTGDLHLQSDNNVILSKDTDTEIMVKGIADGAVELYHNNIKKFETTSSGVAVTGNITVSGTVDGVDIATRDSTLTSTTTTANAALPKAGGTMAGVINMGSNKVTNVTDPTAAQDAATKSYVDTQVAGAGGGGSFVSFGYAQGGGTSTSTLFRFSTPISLPAGHTIVGWSTHEPAPAVSWRDNYQGSTTILGTGSYTNSGGSAVNVYAWCNTSNSNTRGVSYIIFG